jgi:hypothetical protein
MKICKECGLDKDENDYYKGTAKCKTCVKKRVNAHRQDNLEKIRAYDRERGQTTKRKQKNKDYQNDMRKNNPDEWRKVRSKACNKYRSGNRIKANAVQKLERAVTTGIIKKLPCSLCGDIKSEAHHPNYQKPLSVTWLCDFHHKEEHKRLRELKRLSLS